MIRAVNNLDVNQLSAHSRAVLDRAMRASGNPDAEITCFGRNPADQARVMHANCLRDLGAQRRLYLAPGQRVIDVFVADAALDAATTIANMEAEIVRQGPSFVSRHCADQSKLQVIDITESSLTNPSALLNGWQRVELAWAP